MCALHLHFSVLSVTLWLTPSSAHAAELPGTKLLTDDGDLNRFVNVYINGQDVRYLAGLDTPVAPADEVRLLPAMAGG